MRHSITRTQEDPSQVRSAFLCRRLTLDWAPVLLVVAIILSAHVSLKAQVLGDEDDESPEGIEIPIAYPGKIEVLLGEAAPIVLSARSTTTSPIEFLIRTKPKHGVLTEMEKVRGKSHSASLSYSAELDSKAESDFFTYAVRHKGGGVSKEARVDLVLRKPVPKVSLNHSEIDFGRVFIGDEIVRSVTVKNIGTADLATTVVGKAPVSILGSNDLKLARGESRELELVYRPTVLRKLETRLKIGNKFVALSGGGLVPWSVLPELKSEFVWDPTTDRRSAKLEFQNLSQVPITIEVIAPKRILADRSIKLLPSSRQALVLSLSPADLPAMDGILTLQPVIAGVKSSVFKKNISLHASAVPARLAVKGVDPVGSVFLGIADKVEDLEVREIKLTNTGGAIATLTWSQNGSFEFKAGQAVILKPGESMSGVVRCIARTSGLKEGFIGLVLGSSKLKIPLSARILTKVGPAIPSRAGGNTRHMPGHSPNRKSFGHASATLSERNVETVKREKTDALPTVGKVSLDDQGHDSLTISWEKPRDKDYEYVLEFHKLGRNPETREISTFWVPHKETKFAAKGNRVQAVISGLHPISVYKMRLLTVDNKTGFASKPTGSFLIQTGEYSWFNSWGLWVIVPVALAALFFLYRHWRRKREEYGPRPMRGF